MCSFARRPATAKTSPLIESESPDGIQASPIPIDDDDEHELPSFSTVTSSSNKRKRDASTFIISDDDEDKKTIVKFRKASSSKAKPAATTPKKKASKPKATASPNKTRIPSPEKRLRPYRNHAPQTYQARYERALTQRMFLIDRQRTTRSDEHGEYKEEVFDMAGTTGNVYQVTISKLPKCTCPDWRNNRSQCKHIIYVSSSHLLAFQIAEKRLQLTLVGSRQRPQMSRLPSIPARILVKRARRDLRKCTSLSTILRRLQRRHIQRWQTQANRRRLSNLHDPIRGWRRPSLVSSSLRQQHPQSLLRTMGKN